MKTLTLLRHAKSSWDDPVDRDFDRPLNRRGVRAARTIGQEMRKQGLTFDLVIASPAVRVVETLAELAEGYGRAFDPRYEQKVYLASPTTLLEIVQAADDSTDRLLIVGHNPGLESLALMLAAEGALRDELAIKYPTATLAEISFAADHWDEVGNLPGTLVRFLRPRDLDPDLGPED
jgi:phosphohistidine phosphatase